MMSETAQFYETFPFPSPDIESSPINEIAEEIPLIRSNPDLSGLRVLEAGCGTGHYLVGMALRYPNASFLGVDLSNQSLAVARRLAQRHGATNIEFLKASIPELALSIKYDLITCIGVLHHLPDPRAGLRALADHLAPKGHMLLWFYHSLGEHDRMLDRELVLLLTSGEDVRSGMDTVRALGLRHSLARYGYPSEGWTETGFSPVEQEARDADAYLNPIVRPFRFAELPALFEGSGLDWVALHRVYSSTGIRLPDLDGVAPEVPGALSVEDLFADETLRSRLRRMSRAQQTLALELRLRPTGFALVAGRPGGLPDCLPRIRHNLLLG
jgi:SAM-dependent methyltransferase